MRWLKNPMANAAYVALITAIYAAIFIVSSEFVMSYENLLSDSGWASFIISQNMKFVGIGMIGVAVIVDTLSALRRKRYGPLPSGMAPRLPIFCTSRSIVVMF
ncbi:MAG: hypothetical protein UC771_04435 [Faecalibacterium sp.]|nr:hypothetical protein [Faecalibacterium sp.]